MFRDWLPDNGNGESNGGFGMICPNCNQNSCWRDEVDIGVGVQYGPWQCDNCGWYEGHEADVVRDLAAEIIDKEPEF